MTARQTKAPVPQSNTSLLAPKPNEAMTLHSAIHTRAFLHRSLKYQSFPLTPLLLLRLVPRFYARRRFRQAQSRNSSPIVVSPLPVQPILNTFICSFLCVVWEFTNHTCWTVKLILRRFTAELKR